MPDVPHSSGWSGSPKLAAECKHGTRWERRGAPKLEGVLRELHVVVLAAVGALGPVDTGDALDRQVRAGLIAVRTRARSSGEWAVLASGLAEVEEVGISREGRHAREVRVDIDCGDGGLEAGLIRPTPDHGPYRCVLRRRRRHQGEHEQHRPHRSSAPRK